MDWKESLMIVMSTESKILTGVLASALTGLLVALHVVDPTQANTVSGDLQTFFGLLISLIAVGYGLETLLVKHKAETAQNTPPTAPIQGEPSASVASPSAAATTPTQ